MSAVVDELLCFSWVDSLSRSKDYLRTMHYIATQPQLELEAGQQRQGHAVDGRMQPAGLRMVKVAKNTGRWNALDDVENGVVPPDLLTLHQSNGVGDD